MVCCGKTAVHTSLNELFACFACSTSTIFKCCSLHQIGPSYGSATANVASRYNYAVHAAGLMQNHYQSPALYCRTLLAIRRSVKVRSQHPHVTRMTTPITIQKMATHGLSRSPAGQAETHIGPGQI